MSSLNERQIALIRRLLAGGCPSVRELAASSSVSERTIRNDLVRIEGFLEPYGISLHATARGGFRAQASVEQSAVVLSSSQLNRPAGQERIVLMDRVWIDETYASDTDLAHGCGEARKRGLSRQKPCIAVAIDVHENPGAVACGHGRPSAKRIRDGLQSHMAKGPAIVGDKERSHDSLVRAVRGTHGAYRADVGDPVCLERMSLVNNPCPWPKRHLWRFTGMDPKSLQSCLSWYVYLFRVNQARDRWPETERVVRHLLMTDARFHGST